MLYRKITSYIETHNIVKMREVQDYCTYLFDQRLKSAF